MGPRQGGAWYLAAGGSGAPPGPACAAPLGAAAVRWERRHCPGAPLPQTQAPGRTQHSAACHSRPWQSLVGWRREGVRLADIQVLSRRRHPPQGHRQCPICTQPLQRHAIHTPPTSTRTHDPSSWDAYPTYTAPWTRSPGALGGRVYPHVTQGPT